MGLFRKKETYNQQMLRAAGLDRVVFNTPAPSPEAEPAVPAPRFDPSQVHGKPRPRTWDAVTTIVAPGIDGDSASFTVLPNGDLIVESEEGDGDLSPLADAIEAHVSPPYRARASRQNGDLWGVGATRIEVAQFAFPDADSLELAQRDGSSELDINGEPSDATPPPEMQRLGERVGGDFCVGASRIDGDYWEVRVGPL